MLKKIFLSFIILHFYQTAFLQPGSEIDFNKGWKFLLKDDSLASKPVYNDVGWRNLTLPHDWSIEFDFAKENPATNQGGALPGGIGWYRKTFTLSSTANQKKASIEFGGIYQQSEVWINGHYLGKRPNGYISFAYDLTPYLKPAPQKNVIAVKVDNSKQPNSRWYTGSGIYRNVKLIITNSFRFDEQSLFVTTPVVNNNAAIVNVKGLFRTPVAHYAMLKLRISVLAKDKTVISSKIIDAGNVNEAGGIDYSLEIRNPGLWDVSNPYLYRLKLELLSLKNDVLDSLVMPFGIRSFHFDSVKGFFLNNEPLKINGVCMHHDLGALGAAFNVAAAKRQLTILKAMGCNAIRTAHNPPAAEFLDLCDQMGFLVMDEAFDMWQKRKNKFDYHLDFKNEYRKDLADMVLRDRNHPSIFAWSIGNEIREQFDSAGTAITREMVEIVKKLDNTRPVISALTENIPDKNFIYKAGSLDLLGFNYKLNDYKELPLRFPGQKIIATETASALATRGAYDLPADSMRIWPPDSKKSFKGNEDMTVSAYDHAYAYWGATHERSLLAVNKYDFIAGSFVWSGFDFLGEPVPYPWPARSSYYGIIDLAGFPKDVYYMYQSEWTTKPVLHIFPHWNWQPGKTVDVWAYYNNADEVELFLNGKSLGIKKKVNDDLHVMWRVQFHPGTLKAVSRKNGKIVLTKEIKTAGKAAKIELIADRKIIKADGKDLSFVTVRVVDQDGNMVPDADDLIKFSITGSGAIAATDNGYQADTISFKSKERKCWKGMALAIIRSSGKKGNITLTATAVGLQAHTITLKASD